MNIPFAKSAIEAAGFRIKNSGAKWYWLRLYSYGKVVKHGDKRSEVTRMDRSRSHYKNEEEAILGCFNTNKGILRTA